MQILRTLTTSSRTTSTCKVCFCHQIFQTEASWNFIFLKASDSIFLYENQESQKLEYIDQVIALYDFSSTTQETLGFQKDAIINILEKNGDWWLGELNGRCGILPYNYVQSIKKGKFRREGSRAVWWRPFRAVFFNYSWFYFMSFLYHDAEKFSKISGFFGVSIVRKL